MINPTRVPIPPSVYTVAQIASDVYYPRTSEQKIAQQQIYTALDRNDLNMLREAIIRAGSEALSTPTWRTQWMGPAIAMMNQELEGGGDEKTRRRTPL